MSTKEPSKALGITSNVFKAPTSISPDTHSVSRVDWQDLLPSNSNFGSLTSNVVLGNSIFPVSEAKKDNYLTSIEIASHLLLMKNSIESVQSTNHYIFTNNEVETPNETSVDFTSGDVPAWEVKSLKQGLLMQLINHPLKPITYEDDTGANIVEFHNLKSHVVYIADDEGIQLLWTKDSKPYSKFIPDNELSLVKITNNVAQLMSSPE